MADRDEYLTTHQTASKLKVTLETLRRWRKAKKYLSFYPVSERVILYKRTEVEALLQKIKVKAVPVQQVA